MASGSTHNAGSAGSWTTIASPVAICTSSQVNAMATTNNIFQLQLIQLQVGNVATPFIPRTAGEERKYLGRYGYSTFINGTSPAQNNGTNTGEFQWNATKAGANANPSPSLRYPVQLCQTPGAITLYSPAASSAQAYDITASAACTSTSEANSNQNTLTITTTGASGTAVSDVLGVHIVADASFNWRWLMTSPSQSAFTGGGGTVSSVAIATNASSAIAVSGSPITTTGTITLTPHGNLLSFQVLKSGTSSTYTPTSTQVNNIYVEMVGGGGGAGGGEMQSCNVQLAGGGGGGSGYCAKWITNWRQLYSHVYCWWWWQW